MSALEKFVALTALTLQVCCTREAVENTKNDQPSSNAVELVGIKDPRYPGHRPQVTAEIQEDAHAGAKIVTIRESLAKLTKTYEVRPNCEVADVGLDSFYLGDSTRPPKSGDYAFLANVADKYGPLAGCEDYFRESASGSLADVIASLPEFPSQILSSSQVPQHSYLSE